MCRWHTRVGSGLFRLLLMAAAVVGCDTSIGVNLDDIDDRHDGSSTSKRDASSAFDAGVSFEDGGTGQADAGPDAAAATFCFQGDFLPFLGNFHAHTDYSDGMGLPAEAFAYARDVAGLDMLIVTDHLEQLYLWNPSGRYERCKEQAVAATTDQFFAGCGFEYGTAFTPDFQSTGHNNVFFSDDLFPAVQIDFHDFYATLAACQSCIGQFNHPDMMPLKWDDFAYDPAAAQRMHLIELNNNPVWETFFQALDAGWLLSPTHNQDNHGFNWGTADESRTGVYMAVLTGADLAEAMRARRTFASHDRNAALRLMAGTCWMGSVLSGRSSITFTVEATDPDQDDGFAKIELFGPGAAFLEMHDCSGATICSYTTTRPVLGPTYVVARATQSDGQDLVSAPIWLNP